MSGKKAAVNWTIGKLINIVLLTVVMALLIYGLTTGGLNPLIEEVEGRFNEVLIMLNFKEGVSSEECFKADVASLGKGSEFLKDVGLEGNNVVMNVCRTRMCNFTGELSEYRNNKGGFEKFDEGEWKTWDKLFVGDLASVKFDWELYRAVSDVLEKGEGVDFLKNPRDTKKFVLTGDGSGFDEKIVLTWQNGVWVLRVGSLFNVFEDDDEAIDVFARSVWGGDDDIVTYDDGMGGSGVIGELVGDIGFFGSNDELDSEEEIVNLKLEFAKRKIVYLEEVSLSAGDVENLTRVVEGKEVVVDGVAFDMKVREVNGELVITLVSDAFKFGMKYAVDGEHDDVFGCGRSSLPFVLFEEDGSLVSEDYYKFNKECFDKIYRETMVKNFLRSKCL